MVVQVLVMVVVVRFRVCGWVMVVEVRFRVCGWVLVVRFRLCGWVLNTVYTQY